MHRLLPSKTWQHTRTASALAGRQLVRGIHVSAPASAKKKKSTAADFDNDEDDLFGKTSDLFDTPSTPSSSATSTSASTSTSPSSSFASDSFVQADGTPKTKGQLHRNRRAARRREVNEESRTFDGLATFIQQRVGPNATVKGEALHRHALARLFKLCEDKSHLEKSEEILSRFRDTKRVVEDQAVQALVSRIVQLNEPEFAVDLFKNRSKYGLDLTRPLAHQILDTCTTIPQVVALSALYPLYHLGPPLHDFSVWTKFMRLTLADRRKLENRLESLSKSGSPDANEVSKLQASLQKTNQALLDLIESFRDASTDPHFIENNSRWTGTQRYYAQNVLIASRLCLRKAGKPVEWLVEVQRAMGLQDWKLQTSQQKSGFLGSGLLDRLRGAGAEQPASA
ncbi:hypothetical protein SISNIDRAFT_488646 [Sistotremastrum niveocremeum HHB9708]|uniref:Uncharacterized protein n=1 Tax=Sistotremastrum niveocremeum HHB9708 TaxID=1314777 RepID=A0A164QZP5_9AGAM|nr:hypothetical protein SISNIDRAFT_488646 [Sistotremastrum niveocremeum HHB9708]